MKAGERAHAKQRPWCTGGPGRQKARARPQGALSSLVKNGERKGQGMKDTSCKDGYEPYSGVLNAR